MKAYKVVSFLIALFMLFALAACGAPAAAPAPAEQPAAQPAAPAQQPAEQPAAPAEQPAAQPAAEPQPADKTYVIGFAQQFTSEFMQSVLTGCYDYFDGVSDKVDFKVVNAEGIPDTQNSQIDVLIAQGVDAIILNPVDATSQVVAVEAANAAGIPIITVNCQTQNQDKATAYSGCDDVEAGRLMMQRFVDKLGPDMKVVMIQGQKGHSAQIQRQQGFEEVLAKYPTINVVGDMGGVWGIEPAQKNIENLLETGKDFQAVATHSDEQCQGVVNALRAAGIEGVLVGGVDGNFYALDYIDSGDMDCTMYQDGIAQGAGAAKLALAAAKGEQVSDNIVPYVVVSKENIDDLRASFIKRDELIAKYFK